MACFLSRAQECSWRNFCAPEGTVFGY